MSNARNRDTYIKHVQAFSERGLTVEEADDEFFASVKEPKKPSKPTSAMPGSYRRIQVYSERLARGLSIYHPDDADFMGRSAQNMQRVTYSGSSNRSKIGVGRGHKR